MFDVRDPLEACGAFRLLVHGEVERVALQREHDRHEVGRTVGADGGQARHPGITEASSSLCQVHGATLRAL
jgi:hypothetical protein